MGLEFSIEQKQVSSVFKKYRNTIDIYTEDEEKDKEFYKLLFARLLEGTSEKISDIYPLGCSRQVIKKCKEDNDFSRRKLYIVDGDIVLQYNPKENNKYLFVLDAYCIENYVIDKKSVCQTAYMLYPCMEIEKVYEKLNYEKMLLEIAEPLIQLFFHYSIQNECFNAFNQLHIDTYLTKNNLDLEKIDAKIDEIKKILLSNGKTESEYLELLYNRRSKFPYDTDSLLRIVSGKDFLIPYISCYIKKSYNNNLRLPKESWKYNFLKYCDLSRLSNLKAAILSA